MIIVTGANGFIGSNIVERLIYENIGEIIAVDKEESFNNRNYLEKLPIHKSISDKNLLSFISSYTNDISHVIIMSGNSNTMEQNKELLFYDNYRFPKALIDFCLNFNISIIYASSASVYKYYGKDKFRKEEATSLYSKSKLSLDQYVLDNHLNKGKITGLRLFNVYGPNEHHKEHMASMIHRMTLQYAKTGKITLFKGSDTPNGAQSRDFISVTHVSNKVLEFIKHGGPNDIIDIGTGTSIQFNYLAGLIYAVANKKSINNMSYKSLYRNGVLSYIDIPTNIVSHYQSYTRANIPHIERISNNDSICELENYVENILRQYGSNQSNYLNNHQISAIISK